MTMTDSPTFVFDDDGKVTAYFGGRKLATADTIDELEEKVAMMPMPNGPSAAPQPTPGQDQGVCPACGGVGCPECQGQMTPPGGAPSLPPGTSHIRTPSGLTGQILGKQQGLWGDQITIRLENGRIAKFDVTPESKIEYLQERTASVDSPYSRLQERLDATPDGTRESLVARLKELRDIKHEAKALFRTAKYVDEQTLDQIIVTADFEAQEVTDAISALDDAEPFAPPAPFQTGVVEQESVGGGDSTWLDNTVGEMIQEAEGQDFDKMMSEGPEEFVAELDDPALGDAGVVHQMASNFIRSKTAGLDREAVNDFEAKFVARVEEVRRERLSNRKSEMAKEAKSEQENYDGPADSLFM